MPLKRHKTDSPSISEMVLGAGTVITIDQAKKP